MNELQQVLLIFAVVVIAGLYFLSKSRQKNNSHKQAQPNQSKDDSSPSTNKTTLKKTVSAIQQKVNPQASNESSATDNQYSQALNQLGHSHIPLSEKTTDRLTQFEQSTQGETADANKLQANAESVEDIENNENYHPNQQSLFFGEDFDADAAEPTQPKTDAVDTEVNASHPDFKQKDSFELINDEAHERADQAKQTFSLKGKHHVLTVEDPGMTGELSEEQFPAEDYQPSFGIPEDAKPSHAQKQAVNAEPQVFAILILSTGEEFTMTAVNQALLGVGLKYSEQGIFAKNDTLGEPFIKVANMLEPGTFPQENLQDYSTPGVAMILELPTSVRAPAAMEDLILMARKISQRLNGRLYDMNRHLIKESDIQTMRDKALDYESQPLV